MKKKGRLRLLGVAVGGSAAVLVSLAIIPGSASAAPACNAPVGFDCLAIINDIKDASSFRSNGGCITDVLSGKTTFVEQVHIPEGVAPNINAFTGNVCGGESEVTPIQVIQDLEKNRGYQTLRVARLSNGE